MRKATLSLLASAALATMLTASPSYAEDALSGRVSSAEEGPMEGVLVSAQKAGSNITITVVSDKDGHYAFPASKIGPGQYDLRIRAVGYDLDSPGKIEVKSGTTADVKLRKTEDLAAQLSNGERLASMPGTDGQKKQLLNCIGCHTLERPMNSKYTSQEFVEIVLPRMQSYVNQSMPSAPQLRKAERLMEERGDQRVQVYRGLADYLASVNLSNGPWKYELKTAPRPSGRATKVIYTEYDLPNELAQPHDVVVDPDGIAWYSSFGLQNLGRLDPKTGNVTELKIPEHKPGFPTGLLGLRQDPDGNLWMGNMYQATIIKFDRKAEKFQFWPLPKEQNIDAAQVNMASPGAMNVDGKVWAQNNGFAGIHRLDVATGKIETWEPYKNAPKGEAHNIYDVIPDSKNNVYFTDFRNHHIGRLDAKTAEIKIMTVPFAGANPRRGMMDAKDRLWFAEYRGDRIGMLDTKTEKFTEWQMPTKWSAPYDVTVDKNDEAWTGSMVTDYITRLDTKTGKTVEYLTPRETNVRRVFVDNSTSPVTFWVGNNHRASVLKIEPLD